MTLKGKSNFIIELLFITGGLPVLNLIRDPSRSGFSKYEYLKYFIASLLPSLSYFVAVGIVWIDLNWDFSAMELMKNTGFTMIDVLTMMVLYALTSIITIAILYFFHKKYKELQKFWNCFQSLGLDIDDKSLLDDWKRNIKPQLLGIITSTITSPIVNLSIYNSMLPEEGTAILKWTLIITSPFSPMGVITPLVIGSGTMSYYLIASLEQGFQQFRTRSQNKQDSSHQ